VTLPTRPPNGRNSVQELRWLAYEDGESYRVWPAAMPTETAPRFSAARIADLALKRWSRPSPISIGPIATNDFSTVAIAATLAGVILLCRLDELMPGTARGFDPQHAGEDTVFVLRRGYEVRAYRNWCPHQGARLEYRKDRFLSANGERVICHAHGAQFDADSGVCTDGPCLGQSLVALPCRVEDGWVWATL